jgi:YihY family inner membrane protein
VPAGSPRAGAAGGMRAGPQRAPEHNGRVPAARPLRQPWRRSMAARLGRGPRRIALLSVRSLWGGVVGIYQSDDLTHAASIAYYALLSLFPFLLLVISIIGAVTSDEQTRLNALGFVLRYFPTKFEFVTRQLAVLQQSPIQLGLYGSIVLVWASLGVFSATSTAINHAWGVEKQRSYVKHKLVSFLMMLAAATLVMLTVIVISAGQVVGASWFVHVLERFPGLATLRSVGVRFGSTLLLIASVGLVFYFIPNAKVRFRDVWVGAVVTGLLWRVAFEGFAWYVRHLAHVSIHGSIGAVVMFLVWIYTSSVILLYGVEFTACYSRTNRGRPESAPAAPSPRE